jgi:hypothetical protein
VYRQPARSSSLEYSVVIPVLEDEVTNAAGQIEINAPAVPDSGDGAPEQTREAPDRAQSHSRRTALRHSCGSSMAQVEMRCGGEDVGVNYPFAAAKAYDGYIGRWSSVVAAEFVTWLDVPERASWFDVACGTGALTSAVLSLRAPARVDATDPNPERIAFAQQTIRDARASFSVGDGTSIAASAGTYDAVIGGLAFPAIRDTAAALAEFKRVSKPKALVAGYVWDFDGEMQLLRFFWNAATELDPGAEESGDDERFSICQPERLAAAWRSAGLTNVAVRAIDALACFRNLDDLWTPFLSGDSPAQKYVQSLADDRRSTLRVLLQRRLPVAEDGSITLIARAWAVKGET